MGRILRDIYTDTSLSSLLGFKGGTCAYLFYNLTRFSVDLDFDLLAHNADHEQKVYEKIGAMLNPYGAIKDRYRKRNTIFFLLSYGDADHNVKVEISTRVVMPDMHAQYAIKEYLGIGMQVGKKAYLFASKLAALTNRNAIAMRDIYDIWFFAKNNWDIDTAVLKARTGKNSKGHITDCISTIESVKDNEILRGLAELLPDEKSKLWVKEHLREEAIFLLKNYREIVA